MGKTKPFTPASHIIRDVRKDDIGPAQCEALPPIESVIRSVNDYRKNGRPKDPTTKDFDLKVEAISDDFLLEDIIMNGERHVIFSTKQQLKLLEHAKTWFVDGTFKFVKALFKQLFSIHAMVRSNEDVLQVPLACILMSRRQACDYQLILEAIVASFAAPPRLKRVILDFEAAIWVAMETVFPNAELRGCSFHFTQAIYRKVQNLGLQSAYQGEQSVCRFVKKLIALCYIPSAHIRPLFSSLARETDDNQSLQELVHYIRSTWIEASVFKPENWSVNGLPFRTNNDVEGWHNRINKKTKPNTPFYLLIQVLNEEARQIRTNVELLSQKKLKRRLRAKYVKLNKRIFKLWDNYEKGKKSAKNLLRACSHLVAGYE